MPRITPGFRNTALTIAALLAAYPRFAGAATPTNYIGPDGGLWTTSANWSDGIPSSNALDAIINTATPATVQLTAHEFIDNLTVGTANTLMLQALLTVEGTANSNAGVIALNSGGALTFTNNATISGGGFISLAGSLFAKSLYSDNQIVGQGAITASGIYTNAGGILATGGTLQLSGSFANAGSFIEAGSSSVLATTGTITGGTVGSLFSGTVNLTGGAHLQNVSLFGLIQASSGVEFDGNATNNNTIFLTGRATIAGLNGATSSTFTNLGFLQLNANAIISASSSLSLAGGGTVALLGAMFGSSAPLFSDNLIVGQGTITSSSGSPPGLTNTGTILAQGGRLTLMNSGIIANAGGILEAASASVLTVTGTITGGTLLALPGGTVALTGLTSLQNVALSGLIQASQAVVSLLDTTTNAGTLAIGTGGTLSFPGVNNATASTITNTGLIQFGPSTVITTGTQPSSLLTLSGGGTLSLAGASLSLAFNAFSNRSPLNSDQFITGQGTLVLGAFNNSGTVMASFGILSLSTNPANVFLNAGLLKATGGTLSLAVAGTITGTITNTLGTIRADGGAVVIGGTVDGGIIEAINGGTISGSTSPFVAVSSTVRALSGGKIQLGGIGNSSIGTPLDPGVLDPRMTELESDGTGSISMSQGHIYNMVNNANLTLMLGSSNFFAAGNFVNNGVVTAVAEPVNFTLNSLLFLENSTISGPGTLTFSPFVPSHPIFGPLIPTLSVGPLGTPAPQLVNESFLAGSFNLSIGANSTFSNFGTITSTGYGIAIGANSTSSIFESSGTMNADGAAISFEGFQGLSSPSMYQISGPLMAFNGGTINFLIGLATITGPINLDASSAVNFSSSSFPSSLQIAGISGSGDVFVGPNTNVISDGIVAAALALAVNSSHNIRPNGLDSATTKVTSLVLASSSGDFTSTLNLNDNKFILQSTGLLDKSTKASFLQSALGSGMNSGNWMGTGITSGTVAADQSATGSHLTTLGLFDNADMGFTTFGGQTVDPNSLLITTALIGDANLDGTVGLTDFEDWYGHVLQAVPFTEDGDFNHDGVVDGLDFNLWFNAAGANAQPILDSLDLDRADLSALRAAPVPEPATVALLLTISPILLRRRRKRMLPTFKP